MSETQLIKTSTENKHTSHLVKAMQGWKDDLEFFVSPPKGMFGRKAIVETGNVKLNSEELDIEFTVPFDDNLESNEAEIIVYNLSKTTRQAIKWGNTLSITAGYENDTGVIFKGKVSKVSTKTEGMDIITTIRALDHIGGVQEDLKDKTYKGGTSAQYILKDLLYNFCSLPVAVFAPRLNHTYKDEVKIDGVLWEEIKKYAQVCGISVYVNKGMVYARYIYEGDNTNFTASADTGLIGSPEEFEEEVQTDNYKATVKGYKCKMLLQHRMNTASIITLKSNDVSGLFRVRAGKHIFNPDESITEIEVI